MNTGQERASDVLQDGDRTCLGSGTWRAICECLPYPKTKNHHKKRNAFETTGVFFFSLFESLMYWNANSLSRHSLHLCLIPQLSSAFQLFYLFKHMGVKQIKSVGGFLLLSPWKEGSFLCCYTRFVTVLCWQCGCLRCLCFWTGRQGFLWERGC